MSMLISVRQLEKSFASRSLFKDISFAIEEGDRVGLVGPNGAGKSTLMKILVGIEQTDKGEVIQRRGLKVGYLEQSPKFKPGITVMEAVYEGAEIHSDDPYSKVFQILSELSLTERSEDLVESMSGGWKKRVALARELAKDPELLLLDEPTNHLDIESILWLEDFLAEKKISILMVTHDRLFLQRVCNRIFDLDKRNPKGLITLSGDYLSYVQVKEELFAAQKTRETVLKNTMRRETEWLRRGAKARQTKQQARISRAGELGDDLAELREKNRTRVTAMDFGGADRSPKKLIEGIQISKAYGDRILFKNLDILVGPKSRLGLLGGNGCGKTSLIRVLIGQEQPDSGKCKLADDITVAYFDQHKNTLDLKKSVLQNVAPDGDYVDFQGNFVYGKSYLDRFLFRPEQMDMPASKLSGGEQSRLKVAQLMLRPANILVLDEPTNDLDMETLEVLQQCLLEFKGAVILVTHDRYFLDQVSNEILSFPLDNSGELTKFASYLQWEEWRVAQDKAIGLSSGDFEKPVQAAPVEVAETKKKLSNKEKFEFENMEKTIHDLEANLAEAQKQSEDPAHASNASKASELYSEIARVQSELERLYARWAELEAKGK